VETNFQSDLSAAYYAQRYRADGLTGGHVIQLGPGNAPAAREALAAYPGGLQIGGGISPANAEGWLACGASHVIVTSWLFDPEGGFRPDRLARLVAAVGADHLVIDLSCRRSCAPGAEPTWRVAMNRWQTPTDLELNAETLGELATHCAEFLVHAADVEGKCEGIDRELVALLGEACPIPVTYAGGARSVEDLREVDQLSCGRVDLTIGSALDLFGGSGARYADCLRWNLL
jgi:phosphoribosylformimino-5-aminoimidazole carboxamide ribotide isomerase